MNKKAQEKWLSWMNVVVWIIVTIVIVIGISFYNSLESDIRPLEAKLLNQKVIDCLVSEDGSLLNIYDENFDIYKACHLNRDIFESDLTLFIQIELDALDENSENVFSITYGNEDFDIQCKIKREEEKFAVCYQDKIFVHDLENDRTLLMNVRTASNIQGRKLK